MNPGQVLAFLVCLGVILLALLAFEIAVFRVACLLCRVPQPGLARTVGMVLVLLVVPGVVDGVVGAVLTKIYQASRYPLWEAGVVQFFVALPVHMVICASIHAKMMRLRTSEGVTVWFVEKLLKLGLLCVGGGLVAAAVLLRR